MAEKPTDEEIERVLAWTREKRHSEFSDRTYEHGVRYAIEWMLNASWPAPNCHPDA